LTEALNLAKEERKVNICQQGVYSTDQQHVWQKNDNVHYIGLHICLSKLRPI